MGVPPSIADFFARVVPWPTAGAPGVVNMHWSLVKYDHGMGGRPFSSLVDFMAFIEVAKNRPASVKDIYFCLSAQTKMGPIKYGVASAYRNRDTVAGLKAVWVDIDVKGEGYKSSTEALEALFAFCQQTGYPRPTALVFSGSGGMHVYWISDRTLTVDEWRPYAEGLRALGIKFGLKADYGCTIDSVRILRVPGTFNHKRTPATEVLLKALGQKDINFQEELSKFTVSVPPTVKRAVVPLMYDPAALPKRAPPPEATDPEYLQRVGAITEKPPLTAESMLSGCPMMATALKTGGAHADQGLWMLQVLATTFCHNGREVAHKISRGYKTYTEEETDAMFDRKDTEREERDLGWPSCGTFESFGSKQCALCPHKGKIKSPLNLATPLKPPEAELPFTMALPVANEAAQELKLPEGYLVQEKTGYIGMMITKPTGGGGHGNEFILLFLSKMKDPWIERGKGLHFQAEVERDLWVDIFVSYEEKGIKNACIATLSRQRVHVNPEQHERAVGFMTFWMQKLRDEQDAINSVPFGWDESDNTPLGWAYNGKLIRKDGKMYPSGTTDPKLKLAYTPRGDMDTWFKVLKLVTDQKRPGLEVIIAAAFAAPLLKFTGQKGGTLCAYGPSAANKSTAVSLGLAVWGDPRRSKEVNSTSEKSLMRKMGQVQNLPLYWDDVKKEKLEAAAKIANANTEGIDGGKLTAGREQQDRGLWQTIFTVVANASLIDKMISLEHDNMAQVNRVFEFHVPKQDDATPGRLPQGAGEPIVAELENNFGRIGERYSTLLGAHSDELRGVVTQHVENFGKLVQATDDERFWIATIGCLLAGTQVANAIGANLDYPAIKKFLVDAYMELRGRVHGASLIGGDTDNTDNALTEFLKTYSDNSLRTMWLPGSGRTSEDTSGQKVGYLKGPLRDVPIHIGWVIEPRLLRISKLAFEEFLTAKEHSAAMIYKGLTKQYHMRHPIPRGNICAGTTHQGGREQLIVLDVPKDSWLEQVMNAYTPSALPIRSDPPGPFHGAGHTGPSQP
jgi:hypothetical protein